MAISKLTGQMLSNVLVRDGEGLAFTDTANSTPLLYIDVANSRIGVNTSSPTTALTIDGTGFANSFNLTNSLSLGGNVVADGDVGANNLSATANIAAVNLSASGNVNSINVSASGNINSINVSASGNINSVNMTATGNMDAVNVSASGNINSVNVSASGNINATANVYSNNASITSNVATGNLSVTGTATINSLNVVNMSISGNITGNVTTSTTGNITAGNIDTGNITAGNISVTGQAVFGNIALNDTTLSSLGNIIVFAGTDGIAVPIGNTSQRPTTPPAGTVRFNTENNDLETWSGAEWVNTSAQFTQILDQQIVGDNSTTYALDYPTDDNNSIIVSINGITQLPGAAYNVVGTDIEFASALLTSEVADIRYLTYPVPVGEYGNSNVASYLATNTGNIAAGNIFTDNYLYANGTPVNFGGGSSYANSNVVAYAQAGFAGNIIPSANVTYSLGNATNQWKDLWVSNNTIYINSVPLTVTSSNVLQVGGENVITANSSTTGNINTTGNVSANYFVGNGSLLTNLPAPSVTQDIASNGAMSLMTYDGNLKYVSYATVEPSSGNITGGNISAVGNIQGNFFIGNGSQLTGITATANTGNLEITGTLIEIAAGATETSIVISPSGPTGGQAFVDVPDNATANTANLRIYNSLGNIELGTNSGSSSWYFDNTGNLNLPTNGAVNFAGGSIKQALNEDFYIRASDDESDGWSVYNIVDDGAGNILSQTRLEFDQYSIRTDAQGASYTWAFRDTGVLDLPGDIYGNVGNSLTIKIGDQAGSDTFIDLQTRSYIGDALISNVHIAPNITISTANAAHTWTFGDTGNLTFPDTTIQNTAWTGTTDSIANTGNSFTMSSSGVLSLAEGANTYLTLDRFGITADTQMTLQAANSATGNNSAILFDRNGGGIAFRMEDVVANVPGSYNWGFYQSNVLFPDSTRQYTAYPGNATALSLSGNITANYFVGDGSLLTGITSSANTGNVTFSDITIQGSNGLQLSAGPDFTANSAYLQVRSGDQPTHIHFDTGNNQYYDQYFGADDKFVKLEANGNVLINASNLANNSSATWTFDDTGILTVPGEGIIQSFNDTVILQSKDTTSGNIYSARLGTNGGLYFATTEYPGGWLDITNNAGNANITSPINSGGAAGHNLNLTAGAADTVVYNANVGGDLNLVGGTGGFNDDGVGGPGGNVNITAGSPGEAGGLAGNVYVNAGTAAWTFNNNSQLKVANLTISASNGIGASASIFEDNGDLQVLASGTNGVVNVGWAENALTLGNTSVMWFNEPGNVGNAIIRTGNTAATSYAWAFDNTGNLTLPGNTFTVNYANGTPVNIGSSGNTSNVTANNISLNGGYITGGVANIVNDTINTIYLGTDTLLEVNGSPFTSLTRGQVTVANCTTPTEANGVWYYQSISNNTFALYTDNTYSTPLDSSGWTAYTGAGTVTFVKQSPPANIVINSNGFLSTFADDGQVTLPGNLATSGDIVTNGNVYANVATANTITTNTVLTLAIYADDTARDAAIPTPANGMLIFNTAVGNFQGYNGSWGNLTLS